MSGSALRETVGLVGVIASLVFVGWEIHQNTQQARAAAYQEIGIATSQWFFDYPEWGRKVGIDAFYRPQRLVEWSAEDWDAWSNIVLSAQRLTETLELQVELGVLPPDAMKRLGYDTDWSEMWALQAFSCAWPLLVSPGTSPRLRAEVEAARPEDLPTCPVDVAAVMAGTTQ